MTSVRQNERSWVISLISDINQMLSRRTMLIRRAGGELLFVVEAEVCSQI